MRAYRDDVEWRTWRTIGRYACIDEAVARLVRELEHIDYVKEETFPAGPASD